MNIADKFTLNAKDYACQGNTILGIRNSGKSYTASKLSEEMLKKRIPILVFDPTGIWRHLRNGVNGHEGFPVVVVGGIEPDIPLPFDEEKMDVIADRVVLLVRASMQKGISVVIDLFAMPKSNWQKIVVPCIRLLLNENYKYGIRHVILEEAAEFIPQRPHPGNQIVYGLIEQMARTGRNFGIGFTLINQRAEEIAKAVFELCEMVFVHRQKGKNSLKSIREWLDHQAIEDAKGMVASIPKLGNGECWVISDQGEQKIKVNEKETFHPSPKEGKTTVPNDVKVADRTEFIKAMSEMIAEGEKSKGKSKKSKDVAVVADDNAIEELTFQLTETKNLVFDQQNEIVELELLVKEYAKRAADRATVLMKLTGFLSRNGSAIVELTEIMKNLNDFINGVGPEEGSDDIKALKKYLSADQSKIKEIADDAFEKTFKNPTVGQLRRPHIKAEGLIKVEDGKSVRNNEELSTGEEATLIACRQYQNRGGLTKPQIRMMTNYKRRSTDAYIQRLRAKGYLAESGNKFLPTTEGVYVLGSNYKPLPTGKALIQYWFTNLPQGERKVFEILIGRKGKYIEREQIDQLTGYKIRSRNAYIQRLQTRELVETSSAGVRASDFLFD